MNPYVYLIVLNWNMPKDTIKCIESLQKLDYDNFHILLVDNGSKDDSAKILKEQFGHAIDIIENEDNLGFASGNNVGIRYCLAKGADYIFILNNDVIVDKDCLKEIVRAAQERKYANIFAPKVYYYNNPKIINSLGTSINWFRLRPHLGHCGETDKGQFNNIEEKEVLVGCALFIRRQFLERAGLFDELFYMIHEDADMCLRNINSGGKNIVVPHAIAYHKASATIKAYSGLSTYYSVRNFLYLTYKNVSIINRIKVMTGLILLTFKNIILQRQAKAFLFGIMDYFTGQMGKCTRAF